MALRFVVDQPVSPQIAAELRQAGHDAIHVADRGMAAAPDAEIVALAAAEDRSSSRRTMTFQRFSRSPAQESRP